MRPFEGRRVLLVVSGGIAAYKSAALVRLLRGSGARVDVLMTAAARRMVGTATFEALSGRPVHTDLWERPLAHIELGRSADLVVVAPATADLLAAMAHGLAGDFASATLLAAAAPILVCPAMNTRMWERPATARNLERLREDGVHVAGPEEGELAEGEEGMGRMSEPERILTVAGRLLESGSRLAGRRVVVTAGPTREAIDPVRFIGNRSSGRMGFALAAAAWRRGAEVALISGPASVPAPWGPRLLEVETAEEMRRALVQELEEAGVLLMAAAVADFRVAEPSRSKWKKESGPPALTLERCPDLLAETRQMRARRGIVSLGFALETDDATENGRRKLEEKGLDLIAVNEAGRPEAGFEAPTNRVTLLHADGPLEELPLLPKEELAERLLDRLEDRLGE